MDFLPRKRLLLHSNGSYTIEIAEKHLTLLFQAIDQNNDGILSQEEFVNGLLALPFVDISPVEAVRLFTTIDVDDSNSITLHEFVEAARQIRWIRTLVKVYAASREYQFIVPSTYDYTKSTMENYQGETGIYIGDYADIRETRDYSYHKNFIPERQKWQDVAIRCCLGRTDSQPRPWVIFTCGPMGVGKGHVLSWMSSQGLFPLEYIVHVDPDFFKRIMPEWENYVSHDEETAGTNCHQESAYLQEIAQEVALRQRQHVWVDGSLSDGEWFAKIFDDIRDRYPHYRIAIIYINAPEATIRARIAKRSSETGRNIPESAILRSLQSPERSLQLLAPKTDLVVRIWNDSSIILQSVEDHSGNWHRALGRHFGTISEQPMKFPASLGPLYLELTSFHGNMFLPSSGSTKEGVLKLQTTKEEFTPFWFTLTSSNTLSAYRLNKFNRFECVCYWDVDDQTLIRSISDPPSLNDFVLRKKRDYDCYSEGYLFNDPDISFQISFSSTCCMAPRESCCILPDDSQTITLLAPDYASKCSWMETIQRRIVTLSDHSSTSPCTSPTPQSLGKSRTLPHNGSTGGFQRSATTESVLSQQGYINLPPVDSQQYEFLDLSPLQCQSSPPLIQLFWNISTTIQLTASPKYRLLGKTEELELSGIPKGATHSRFVFPYDGDHFRSLDLESLGIDSSDPDLLFISWGGFVHYNALGTVVGATALSEVDTQYFIQYSSPEFLHSEDANR